MGENGDAFLGQKRVYMPVEEQGSVLIQPYRTVDIEKPSTPEERANAIVTRAREASNRVSRSIKNELFTERSIKSALQSAEGFTGDVSKSLGLSEQLKEARFPDEKSEQVEQIVLWALKLAPEQFSLPPDYPTSNELELAMIPLMTAFNLAEGVLFQRGKLSENGDRTIGNAAKPLTLRREEIREAINELAKILGVVRVPKIPVKTVDVREEDTDRGNKKEIQQAFYSLVRKLPLYNSVPREGMVRHVENTTEETTHEKLPDVKTVPITTAEAIETKISFTILPRWPWQQTKEITVRIPGVEGKALPQEIVRQVEAALKENRRKIKTQEAADELSGEVVERYKKALEVAREKVASEFIRDLREGRRVLTPDFMKEFVEGQDMQLPVGDGDSEETKRVLEIAICRHYGVDLDKILALIQADGGENKANDNDTTT